MRFEIGQRWVSKSDPNLVAEVTQLLDQGRSAHVDVRDASGQLLQRDNVVYAQSSANWTLQYTPDQFEVDLSERTVRRKPSGIVFSFYEYTSEADWQRSDSVTMRDVPTWAGDRTRLAAFAKQAAIDSGMKAGRMRGLREKLEHAPQTAQQFDRERALKQWRESVDHLFRQVEGCLSYVKEGNLGGTIRRVPREKHQELLGHYMIDALVVETPSLKVLFDPR